jgi:hypothetical protein
MNYHLTDGTANLGEMSAEQIIDRVLAQPGLPFKVWRDGLSEWVDPMTQPDLQALLTSRQAAAQQAAAQQAAAQQAAAQQAAAQQAAAQQAAAQQAAAQQAAAQQAAAQQAAAQQAAAQQAAGQQAPGAQVASAATAAVSPAPAKQPMATWLKLTIGIGGTVVGLFLILFILAGIFGSSRYERGITALDEKNYDEALTLFSEVPADHDDYARAQVGVLVAQIGQHYVKGEYDKAMEIVRSTYSIGADREAYKLNVAPDDPLYPYAATLAVLSYGRNNEETIKRFLADSPNSDEYSYWFEGETEVSGMANWVLTTGGTDGRATYSPVEEIDPDYYFQEPFILSYKLDSLKVPTTYKSEADAMVKQMKEYDIEVKKRSAEYEERTIW